MDAIFSRRIRRNRAENVAMGHRSSRKRSSRGREIILNARPTIFDEKWPALRTLLAKPQMRRNPGPLRPSAACS
jgi:hypothetical protein